MSASLSLNDPTLLQTNAFIDGVFTAAPNGKTFAVTNPATGDIIAEVADCGADDILRAIAAAEMARHSWAATTALIEKLNPLSPITGFGRQ